MQIVDFKESHVEDAAALAAARFKALRASVPELPARYENPAEIAPMLSGMPGVAAIEGGQMRGFLTGMIIHFMDRRTAYSPEWAAATGPEDTSGLIPQLYTEMASRWTAGGCTAHLLTLFAGDRATLDAWTWTGFGMVVVDAVRGLDSVPDAADDVEISRATAADADAIAGFDSSLREHMIAPPTFQYLDESRHDRAGWEAEIDRRDSCIWLARHAGKPIAYMHATTNYDDVCTIVRDEGTVHIIGAYTEPGDRRKGVAAALLNRCTDWARSGGFTRLAVDFETANVPATRFWMRYFRPVCYSAQRVLDGRALTPADR